MQIGLMWKDIPGYEGYYQASNKGDIKSLKRTTTPGGILKQQDRIGYYYVELSKNGIRKPKRVHRLVCAAFYGDSVLQVNHKDGNKKNNNIENLEWCTASENQKHRFNILGHTNIMPPIKYGKEHCRSILIGQYNSEGNLIKKYWGGPEASRQTGISASSIGNVLCGKSKTAGGFVWRKIKNSL